MRRHTGESGQAVIAATIIVSLVLLMLLTMITQTQIGNRLVGRQLTYQGQAANAAQAGLVEGLSWFRKQAVQPVTTFQPIVNASANPPINDSEDTTIGIVRTYQVSAPGRLMGRYEVRLGNAAAGTGVLDVTTQKGRLGAGAVWQLESVGTIWVQNDATLPNSAYNTSPNTVLSQQTFRTEIQKMSVLLPEAAALFSANCDNVKIDTKTKVQGGSGFGVACRPGSGGGITNNGVITGSPNIKQNSVAPYSIPAVFSVSQQELTGLADVNVSQTKDLPSPLPAMSLIVINGDATFGPNSTVPLITPLVGSGILVVFGNLTINSDPSNDWNGVIYVTGNLSINEPIAVSGSIIAANASGVASIAVNSGADISEVDYSPAMISQINTQMALYRFSRSKYWIGK
jgi:hypothetical protein